MCEEFALSFDLLDPVVSGIKSSKRKIQIWGIGNVLLGDDAVGPMISTRLGGIDCGTAPENYISKLRKDVPEILIIIDAAEMGLKAGSIRVLNYDELSGEIVTTHGMPLSFLLEQFNKTIDIILIGIQPKQTNLGEPLSDEVRTAAELLIEKLSYSIP